ncbi:hypothetical protein GCM10027280_49470 [Micromonospora polyrhachis]|uniref:Uncharacterized protein n=1 Tax=Micromonospora polyrhachis TaxID=1282883 RepID=A0A7W7WR40_9ACTN|nr:N-acetyltransferase [Micromonospora polyrhachis]MBB4960695.1 hypothetical protein [Micromonospora polyrhachis]
MNRQRVIRRARYVEATIIAKLVATASHELPIAAWLVPDDQQRMIVLTDVARIWVEHALFFGEIEIALHATGAIAGTTVWFHRNGQVPAPAAYRQRLTVACREHADRFISLGAALAAHPPDTPCQQLAFVAVTDDQTDNETTERLLAHHHTRLDTHDSSAYALACNDSDRDLLSRYGYQPGQQIHLPGGHIAVPMWRPAPPQA